METVTCTCLKCSTVIGTFTNSFIRIGKAHYSPVHGNQDAAKELALQGEVRPGAKNTMIENCMLQDLGCTGCGELLGIYCVSSSEGHILARNPNSVNSGQSILRMAGLRAVSDQTGEKATLIVKKSYPLQKGSSKVVEAQKDLSSPIPIDPALLQENGQARLNGTSSGEDHADDRLRELDSFADWAADAIRDQKKDIDRISVVVGKIEKDMRTFKDFMTSMRKEFGTKQGSSDMQQISQNVVYIQHDLDDLRMEMQSFKEAENHGGCSVPTEELDVMAESISHLSSKVNEVETLKLEIQFMKSRLKRLEEGTRSMSQAPEMRASVAPDSIRRTSLLRASSSAPSLQQSGFKKPIEPPSSLVRASIGPQVPTSHKRHSLQGRDATPSFKRPRLPDTPISTAHRRSSNLSQVYSAEDVEDDPEPETNDLTVFIDESDHDDEDYHPKKRRPRATILVGSSPDSGTKNDTPQRRKPGPPKGRPSLVNADGVKVTKAGLPDKRVGNIKNIRAWQNKQDHSKETEESDEQNANVPKCDNVLPSVEAGANNTRGKSVQETAEQRQAALEARERLVRETIERDL